MQEEAAGPEAAASSQLARPHNTSEGRATRASGVLSEWKKGEGVWVEDVVVEAKWWAGKLDVEMSDGRWTVVYPCGTSEREVEKKRLSKQCGPERVRKGSRVVVDGLVTDKTYNGASLTLTQPSSSIEP